MSEEEIYLKVIDENHEIFNSNLKIIDYGSRVKLDFTFRDCFISEIDDYPFLALNKLRLKLEEKGLKLVCQGARIDVNPSGMQLEGFNAYELELSKSATNSVYIFDDTAQIEKLATVDEQAAFFEQWLKSVGFSNSKDKVDIYDPQNTLGEYWFIINLENWVVQSLEYKDGIIESIKKELQEIQNQGYLDIDDLKLKFENKLKIKLDY
jgi:hypothetical protein